MSTQKQPEKVDVMKDALSKNAENAGALAKFERQDRALRAIAEKNAGSLTLSLDRKNENDLSGSDVDRGILNEAKALEVANAKVRAHQELMKLAQHIEPTV